MEIGALDRGRDAYDQDSSYYSLMIAKAGLIIIYAGSLHEGSKTM